MSVNLRLSNAAYDLQQGLCESPWFRAHPETVPAYASFKRSLAAISPDVGTYAEVKDPVVDLVMVAAETWAAETGWSVSVPPAVGPR